MFWALVKNPAVVLLRARGALDNLPATARAGDAGNVGGGWRREERLELAEVMAATDVELRQQNASSGMRGRGGRWEE